MLFFGLRRVGMGRPQLNLWRLIRKLFYSILVFCCMFGPASNINAEYVWRVREIQETLNAERHKLISGIAFASGHVSSSSTATSENDFSGTARLKCVFDFGRGFYLSDYLGPLRPVGPVLPDAKRNESQQFLSRIIYGRKGNISFHYSQRNPAKNSPVYIAGRDEMPSRAWDDAFFMDIRAAGLVGFVNMLSGRWLEEIVANWFATVPSSISTDESTGKLRIRWNYGEERANILIIDLNSGFTPIQFLDEWSPAIGGSGDSEVVADTRVQWKAHAGTYIPVKISHTANLPYIPNEIPDAQEAKSIEDLKIARRRHNFEFEILWENVNGDIAPELFDYREMNLPAGTHVYEKEGGELLKFIHVETLGTGEAILIEKVKPGRTSWKLLTIVSCILIALFLLGQWMRST